MNVKNQNQEKLENNNLVKNLLHYYSASELEDTLFDVFEEANLYSDFTYEEKEKRKLLHETLRKMFRDLTIDQP